MEIFKLIDEIVAKIKEIPQDQLEEVITCMIEMNHIEDQEKFREAFLSMYHS